MNERCVRTGLAGVMMACSVLLGGQLAAAEHQHGEGESKGRMIPITRNDAMELSRAAVQIKRRAIVTVIKLARYYQIENKLDSIVNYDLARTIPLVN